MSFAITHPTEVEDCVGEGELELVTLAVIETDWLWDGDCDCEGDIVTVWLRDGDWLWLLVSVTEAVPVILGDCV
jgi:hypothetical protein